MPVRRPTPNELQDLARQLGFHLESDELEQIGALRRLAAPLLRRLATRVLRARSS